MPTYRPRLDPEFYRTIGKQRTMRSETLDVMTAAPAPMTELRGSQRECSKDTLPTLASIRAFTSCYSTPSLSTSLGQMANSFLPCLALFVLMYASLELGYGVTLALSVVTAAFIVRIFIIQHDCGHGSFFRSRTANHGVGILCSLFTLTPYGMWRRQHAGHHAHWNNLDHRMSGIDIYSTCLTVDEYRALSWWRRILWRAMLHPVVLLLLLPPLVFLVIFRLPFDAPRSWTRERTAVLATNLALLAIVAALGFGLGFLNVLLVHLPTSIMASVIGVWLFSLQHRFEGSRWTRGEEWTPVMASLQGSSHLHLPRILQWFTGNIGFHHVHHLDPRVPNYRLEACHRAHPAFERATTLTLRQGALLSSQHCLWDETTNNLVKLSQCSAPGSSMLKDQSHPSAESNHQIKRFMDRITGLDTKTVIGQSTSLS